MESAGKLTNTPPFDRLVKALTSTLSLKIIMGVTGMLGAGFVLFHMLGHLQVFLGRDPYNAYAETLQGLGPIKWAARLGLLMILVLHVMTATVLVRRNQGARLDPYASLRQRRTSVAAMYMAEIGVVLLLFLIYHILHFTLGVVHAEFNGQNYFILQQVAENGPRHDLYSHFIASFQQPAIALTYIVASIALAAHLGHGATSMFKTLGLAVGRWRVPFETIGPAFGVLVGLGNISMPIAVWAGIIGAN